MSRHHSATALLLAVAAMQTLFGCSNDGDKYPDDIYTRFRYDIVTYNGLSGESPTFTYVPRGDSSAVTLLAQNSLSTSQLAVGKRVLLRYSPEQGSAFATSGTQSIHAFFFTSIISDSLRAYRSSVPVCAYPMQPVKVRSIWRTGDYINLHGQVEYTGKPRVFMLVVDPASVHADTVQCYLVHDMHADTTYFWRNCYASFHVGKLWGQQSCRTLRVHVNNAANSQENCFDFSK